MLPSSGYLIVRFELSGVPQVLRETILDLLQDMNKMKAPMKTSTTAIDAGAIPETYLFANQIPPMIVRRNPQSKKYDESDEPRALLSSDSDAAAPRIIPQIPNSMNRIGGMDHQSLFHIHATRIATAIAMNANPAVRS